MSDKTNTKSREIKMLLTEHEYQQILKEIEVCKLSQSDFLRIMHLFGKFFVSDGRMIVDPKNLGNRIWGLIAVGNVFGTNISNTDLSLLSASKKILEEKKE